MNNQPILERLHISGTYPRQQTNVVFAFQECYNEQGGIRGTSMKQLAQDILAPLTLRLGLAFFFAFQGLSKLGPDNNWGSAWTTTLHSAAQVPIAWGQLLGAAALAFGFLTRLFALLVGGILVASILAVHGMGGFDIRNRDLPLEYIIAILAGCVTVFLLGSGTLGLDVWLWRKKKPK